MHQILGSLIKSGTFRPEAGIPRLRLPEASLQDFQNMSADMSVVEGYDEFSSSLPQKAEFEFPWGRIELDGGRLKTVLHVAGEYIIPVPACVAGRTDLYLLDLPVKCDSIHPKVVHAPDVVENKTRSEWQVFNSLVKSSTFSLEPEVPRLRTPNISLRKGTTVTVDVSTAKRFNEIKLMLPQKSRLGFSWGKVEQEGVSIVITASVPGEYVIPIPACTAGRSELLFLQLTVNPDPNQLLQKELPPPDEETATYYKKNFADPKDMVLCVNGTLGHIVGASRRGQSHALDGTFRDDDLRIESAGSGVYFFAVADGAGSAKFARRGSELAVENAIKTMRKTIVDGCWDCATGFSIDGAIGVALLESALASLNSIMREIDDQEVKDKLGNVTLHDYNTTLLLAAVKVGQDKGLQIASFAIGDGAIVWSGTNKFELLTNPDGGEYSGETYFLTTGKLWRQYNTDKIAFQRSRVKLLTVTPDEAAKGTLMLMTDGVTDPFFPNPIDLTNNDLWQKFIDEQIRATAKIDRNAPATKELGDSLLDWINFRKKGHFDDRTLVIFELADGNSELPPSSVDPADSGKDNPQPQTKDLNVSESDKQESVPKSAKVTEVVENNSQEADKEVPNA